MLYSITMHSSTILEFPPISVFSFCSCEMVCQKQKVCFLLYLIDLLVTRQLEPLSIGLKLTMLFSQIIKIDSWLKVDYL